MSGEAFIENNAFFMAVLLILTGFTAYARSRWTAFVLIAWASANLFWDFLFHLGATVWWGVYSPGLITAALLYFPVSYVVGRAALADGILPKGEFAGACALGAALMAFVVWSGLYHFAV
ncbi:MAG TPA: HXXEE domain-containing protein, partial [Rhizomicrobium sp.]|nr:HXXEE domain-containing protein [Rhizomicrobium sp.]